MTIAIIGGTGVYDPALLTEVREESVTTPYGEAAFLRGFYQKQEVIFLNRHGKGHSVPPHLINYRANIQALQMAGATQIIATAAVGSLNPDYPPGSIVMPDQFLDFTKVRRQTFYEGGPAGVVHCDMTVPYCPNLRALISQVGETRQIATFNGGTYVCTEGPRFETAAEIKMFKSLGGDLIGMTSVPEVNLSRELGLCYANLSVVTNFAAGILPQPLSHQEVLAAMRESIGRLRVLMLESVLAFAVLEPCNCADILADTGGKG